jgi:hypothetical protein
MTAPTRALLGLSVLAAWVGTALQVVGAERIAHPRGLSAAVDLSVLLSPAAWAAMTATLVALIGAHVVRWRPVATGVAVVALFALVTHVENSLYPGDSGVHHGKLLPVGVLIATCGGLAWGGEHVAREASAGVVAASYTIAGVTKLWASGASWVLTVNLPLLVAERAVLAPAPLAQLRHAVATSPGVCFLGGLVVLCIELAGVSFLWPRFRRPFAIAMIASHAAIGVLMGYSYPEWILVLVALGLVPAVRS